MDVFDLVEATMKIVMYIDKQEEAAKTANNKANLQGLRKIITLNCRGVADTAMEKADVPEDEENIQ